MILHLGVEMHLECQWTVKPVHKPWWDLEPCRGRWERERLVLCLYLLGPHHFCSPEDLGLPPRPAFTTCWEARNARALMQETQREKNEKKNELGISELWYNSSGL